VYYPHTSDTFFTAVYQTIRVSQAIGAKAIVLGRAITIGHILDLAYYILVEFLKGGSSIAGCLLNLGAFRLRVLL